MYLVSDFVINSPCPCTECRLGHLMLMVLIKVAFYNHSLDLQLLLSFGLIFEILLIADLISLATWKKWIISNGLA